MNQPVALPIEIHKLIESQNLGLPRSTSSVVDKWPMGCVLKAIVFPYSKYFVEMKLIAYALVLGLFLYHL